MHNYLSMKSRSMLSRSLCNSCCRANVALRRDFPASTCVKPTRTYIHGSSAAQQQHQTINGLFLNNHKKSPSYRQFTTPTLSPSSLFANSTECSAFSSFGLQQRKWPNMHVYYLLLAIPLCHFNYLCRLLFVFLLLISARGPSWCLTSLLVTTDNRTHVSLVHFSL